MILQMALFMNGDRRSLFCPYIEALHVLIRNIDASVAHWTSELVMPVCAMDIVVGEEHQVPLRARIVVIGPVAIPTIVPDEGQFFLDCKFAYWRRVPLRARRNEKTPHLVIAMVVPQSLFAQIHINALIRGHRQGSRRNIGRQNVHRNGNGYAYEKNDREDIFHKGFGTTDKKFLPS